MIIDPLQGIPGRQCDKGRLQSDGFVHVVHCTTLPLYVISKLCLNDTLIKIL